VTDSAFDISVVVPTYNGRETVMRSMETLFRQDFAPSRYEVIVVVDGSSDGTAEALLALNPPCHFRVIEQENRGPSSARNRGFREAQSELILFLDDDMQCDPGLLSAHFRAHQSDASQVAFGALFLSPDSNANLASECFKREIGAFHIRHQRDPNTPWNLADCTFSNASIALRMLEEVGGFDEQFRMREDLELGVRLLERGARMEYVNDAIAYQHYNKTASDLLTDAEKFGVADLMFARKHPQQVIEGHLKWQENQRGWKDGLRKLMARSPVLEACLLAPWCRLGDTFFNVLPLRAVGVRALQMRRRIHWLRAIQRLSSSEGKSLPAISGKDS
jgi:GT2 family glycosyltransferase